MSKHTHRSSGFTIVELLIVIVVIAILAAITVVVFNGMRDRAEDSATRAEINGWGRKLTVHKVSTGSYPSNPSEAGLNLPADSTNQQTRYAGGGDTFCLMITRGKVVNSISSSTAGNVADGPCQAGIVTTLAGSGVAGNANGSRHAAQFRHPRDIAVDSTGTLYVADYNNHRIRKITASGVVTTLAGSSSGDIDGTGTAARFSYPAGVTLDSSGVIYVADTYNHKIKKISPSGVVTTIAGSTIGYADGNGSEAQFTRPWGIAVDNNGNLYVADSGNQRIRKITPSSTVTTLAGNDNYGSSDGTGSAAQFNGPSDIAISNEGILFVADFNGRSIRRVTQGGVVTTIAGGESYGYADGSGSAARFASPRSVAIDLAGILYVSDEGNNRIRKVTQDGSVTTLAGSTQGYADGTGTDSLFYWPSGVAVDSTGAVYVGDYGNHRIRKIE